MDRHLHFKGFLKHANVLLANNADRTQEGILPHLPIIPMKSKLNELGN